MSNYTPNVDDLTECFKALSNPNRLRLLLNLTSCCAPGTRHQVEAGGGAYVGELAASLDIAPSTVSHHIKELRRAGLIRVERKGRNVECWIDADVVDGLAAFFASLGPSPTKVP